MSLFPIFDKFISVAPFLNVEIKITALLALYLLSAARLKIPLLALRHLLRQGRKNAAVDKQGSTLSG